MYSSYITKGSQLRPGLIGGFYPERPVGQASLDEKFFHSFMGYIKNSDVPSHHFKRIIPRIRTHCDRLKNLNEAGLEKKTGELRIELHRQGLTEELTAETFALIHEYSCRTLGMSHYNSQLTGAWIMVHGGLAEMDTGEGKTLTATLAAATAALAGIPVHIVSVNDYLVARDAQQMAPLYRALGLTVGSATTDKNAEARRKEYGCDITYCTNKQLAFDYLRDRILLAGDHGRMRLQLEKMFDKDSRTDRLFLRGLCFAIVDEADSVLIDEARTPLIISRKVDSTQEEETYEQALALAGRMEEGRDYEVDLLERTIQISEEGRIFSEKAAQILGDVWRGERRREELLKQALSALYLFDKDYHYLVYENKIYILDENTGRTMPDRAWEHGLHQMIELKENCEMTGRREPLGRLTYQSFFRRYLCLAGMTGTAKEVRRELWSVYHLPVSRVKPNKKSQRVNMGKVIYPDKEQKWKAVVEKITALHRIGRPVLVGTRSVADSQILSDLLELQSLSHQVLNARQDKNEAQIVATAGNVKSITVATNMAGRGTDIPLGPGVIETGGLHVISTECNESGRIDRQLYGRCGRQGDPGSYECLLSLDDGLLQYYQEKPFWSLALILLKKNLLFSQPLRFLAMRRGQKVKERHHKSIRRNLMRKEEQLGRMLAFSGRME